MLLRDRLFLAVSLVVIAGSIAVGGKYLGARATSVGFDDAAAVTDGTLQASYKEALDSVAASYAGPYEIEAVNKRAIQGMLRTLDPHSTFFDSREYSELKNQQQSQFYGIGVTI